MKTLINKRNVFICSFFALILIFISSCKKDRDEVIITGNAQIRVVNAAQGSNPQDFYQNDKKISTSAVAYGEASSYLTVDAGNSMLYFKNANSTTITASTDANINTNTAFTVFYYNTSSGAGQIKGFQDDTNAPPSGKVKVRFVNLGSALNNNISVSINGGATLISGLAYGFSSSYGTIDANTALGVTVLNSTSVTTIPGTHFQSGKIYTIWFDAASSTTVNFHVIQQN